MWVDCIVEVSPSSIVHEWGMKRDLDGFSLRAKVSVIKLVAPVSKNAGVAK